MKTLRCSISTLLAAAFVFSAGNSEAQMPTPSLNDVGDNTWVMVDKGGVTSSLQMMAYSGGWYDPEHHQFCIFGGGHYNYSGNEVWCFDIAELQWREMYQADVITRPPYEGGDQGAYNNFDNEKFPGALFNPKGESIENARPMSRHTYDSLEHIPGTGAVLWGGIAWGDIDMPWCVRCEDTWAFHFQENRWRYLYNGRNPSPNTSPGVGASAYSVKEGLLYAKVLNETWAYDPERNHWSKIRTSGNPPWSIEGTMESDPVNNYLYFFGGNYETNLELWRYDIAKKRWKRIDADGEGPGEGSNYGPGMAYDVANDSLLIYSAGTIWVYDPSTNSWSTHRPDVRPSDTSYVYGRFRYDPVNQGFWLHAPDGDEHSTWFYRHRRK
jgi:hypothetical protein